ncbi:MAG TPA: MarR family transcriptional regulator [Ktedonobacterales bacterium]|nr:MarR family transcriptional regulator [Ktedonobacterales bacterium]
MRSRDALAPATSQGAAERVFVIEDSLGYLVNYLAKLFSQLHAACLSEYGVHLGQWGVLMFLWVQDGQTQRELSRQVAIDDASMVRAIDRMERDGLVRRQRNAQDRRQSNVFLTERGRSLRDQLIPCATSGNALATQGLTEAEVAQFTALSRRMIAALEGAMTSLPERTAP